MDKKKLKIYQLELFKKMQLFLKAKKVYGITKYYPDCPTSQLILRFMKRAVFMEGEIEQMKGIGWELEIKNE
jgi:hypothetical protein